jgi:hypothetical protein
VPGNATIQHAIKERKGRRESEKLRWSQMNQHLALFIQKQIRK